MQNQRLLQLESTIQPLVKLIWDHPVFSSIHSLAHLRQFSEIHVYSVWDGMCLLKALQHTFSGSQPLWVPPQNHLGCYLINNLIAKKESDYIVQGYYSSDFELYIEAMQQYGADVKTVLKFIEKAKHTSSLSSLFNKDLSLIPKPAEKFMRNTFSIIAKKPHQIAASFIFSRKYIALNMYEQLIEAITTHQRKSGYSLSKFIYYLKRNIEANKDKQNVEIINLLPSLCGLDDKKWQEATETVFFSLKSSLQLLDEICAYVR